MNYDLTIMEMLLIRDALQMKAVLDQQRINEAQLPADSLAAEQHEQTVRLWRKFQQDCRL